MNNSRKTHLHVLLALLSVTSISLADDAYTVVDTYATNWFGISKSTPIDTGCLVVHGNYISPPYTVEQRGYAILVNGEVVELGAQPHFVFPGTENNPIKADPGMPRNVTEKTSAVDLIFHPISRMKYRYWDNIGLDRDEYVQRCIEYYHSFPCIKQIDEIETGHSSRRFVLTDISGGTVTIGIKKDSPNMLMPPTSEYLLTNCILPCMKRIEESLRANTLLISSGKSVYKFIPNGAHNWSELVKVVTNAPWPDELRLRLGDNAPYWDGSINQNKQ